MVNDTIVSVLADLKYKYSMNHFYEVYGDGVEYAKIEQDSYIGLKEIVFEKINKKVKFKKYLREGMVLTIKIDIEKEEYDKLLEIAKKMNSNKDNSVRFIHDYQINNLRFLK